MARRTYGAPVSSPATKDKETDAVVQSDLKVDSSADIPHQQKPEKNSKLAIAILISVVVVSFVLIIICVNMLISYLDIGNGADSPDKAAVGYVESVTDYEAMKRYLPPEIRNSGYIVDNNGLSEIQALNEEYGVTFTDIEATIDTSDVKIDELEKSLNEAYNADIDIDDATKLVVNAVLTYNLNESKRESVVVFNLISIKSGAKWYIYTADLISEDYIPSIKEDDSSDEGLESEIVEDNNVDFKVPVNKPQRELDIYDGVVDDLREGKISIDDMQYTLPAPYSDMTWLYTLSDDAIDMSMRIIQPNYILKNLPISFVKDDYGMTDFRISIGNASDESIDVADGIVTTLYIGVPKFKYEHQIYDYPSVFLPGNVTLMSSYGDVVSVYGHLDNYTNDNESLYLYSDDAKVYQFNLNGNVHNHIYFQFVDDKLVAIQYHYYDLNEF